MPRSLALRLGICALLVLATCIWGFSGRGNLGVSGDWVLSPNLHAWPIGAWGLPFAVILIFGGAAALSVYDRFKRAKTRKEQTNSTVTALICLAMVGILWPWALLGPGQIQAQPGRVTMEGRFNIIVAQWSDVATQYLGVAYQISDAREFCRTYAQTQQNPASRALAHVATHPPGATLFFYAARRLAENTGLDGILTTVSATLTAQTPAEMTNLANLTRETAARSSGVEPGAPLPTNAIGTALFCALLMGLSLVAAIPAVYGLGLAGGNENGEGEARGLLSVALWILAPTTNLFAFTLDALVAAGAVWTLFFAVRAFETHKARWAIAAGLLLGLTSFISLGALALAVVLLAIAGFKREKPLWRSVMIGAASFVGFWLVVALWGGFNPVVVARQASAAHHFATLAVRTYAPWIVMNGVVWALFCGWPLSINSITIGRDKAKQLIMLKGQNQVGVGFLLGSATIMMLLLLSLSGNVRGEVERLWLFTLAPLAVGAVWNSALNARYWAVMVGLQTVQTLVMAATLAPLVRPF